jgi:hypothetical protein
MIGKASEIKIKPLSAYDIDEWLSKNSEAEIIDIKFTASHGSFGVIWSGLIIYKEPKQDIIEHELERLRVLGMRKELYSVDGVNEIIEELLHYKRSVEELEKANAIVKTEAYTQKGLVAELARTFEWIIQYEQPKGYEDWDLYQRLIRQEASKALKGAHHDSTPKLNNQSDDEGNPFA